MTRRFWKCENKKVCRVCKEEKEIPENFIKNGDYICHDCIKKYQKEYRKKNIEQIRNLVREHYKTHNSEIRKRIKNRRVKLREECLKLIGSKCSICDSREKICFHEIHGKRHELGISYIKKHYQDFVPLCKNHHIFLHSLKREEIYLKQFIELAKNIEFAKGKELKRR